MFDTAKIGHEKNKDMRGKLAQPRTHRFKFKQSRHKNPAYLKASMQRTLAQFYAEFPGRANTSATPCPASHASPCTPQASHTAPARAWPSAQ